MLTKINDILFYSILFYSVREKSIDDGKAFFLPILYSLPKVQYTLLYHKRNVSCNRCCNAHGAAVGSHTVRYVNIWQTQQIKQQRDCTLLTKSCIFIAFRMTQCSSLCIFYMLLQYLFDRPFYSIQGNIL